MLELLEFPDDLLLQIFAGCGARACARAATCCKRLRSLAGSCGHQKSMYSSATSCEGTLRQALADATKRALEGITGTLVDFALVFISSYPAQEFQHVVPTLRRLLPKGTGVIGCTTDGLMGLDAKGQGMEKDPSEKRKAKEAVAILLGRVPGSHVCLIPDYRAAVRGAPELEEDAAATFSQGLSYCLGLEVYAPDAEGAEAQRRKRLTQVSQPANLARQATSSSTSDSLRRRFPAPSCVWLLAKDDDCHSVMSRIGEMEGHPGQIPVAGGHTSASFFSHGADQASRFPHFTDQHLQRASFVALALCPKETWNSGNSSHSDTAAVSQTAHTDATLQAAQAGAESTSKGASPQQVGIPEKQASGPPVFSAAPSSTAGVVGAPRLPATHAAALTFIGVGPEVGSKVHRASELRIVATSGLSEGRLFSLSMKLESIPGACAAEDFTHELDRMYERGSSLEGLALWPEGAGDNCSLELLQKGQALILIAADTMEAVDSIDGSEVIAEGAFYVGNDIEKEQLFHRLRHQHQTFCVQLMSINADACRAQLPRDLQVLQRACDRASEQDFTHYWHAQQSAAVAGACSSPMALVAFSCNGRGRRIFGQDPASSEAHLVARATRSSVAFIGGRMFGEIGPEVLSSNGLAGWGFSPGHKLDTSTRVQPAPASGLSSTTGNPVSSSHEAVASGRSVLIVPGSDAMPGRELALAASGTQGFTTIYAAVS